MLAFVRQRCLSLIQFSTRIHDVRVRYASSSKKTSTTKTVSPSTPVLAHNWLETTPEFNLTDSSFNTRFIQYLSDSSRIPLNANIQQHLFDSFQNWSPKEFYDFVYVLGSHGLQPIDVLCLLINLPSTDKTILTIENLKKTFDNLLQLKFDTTTRSILISNDPNLIQYDLPYLRERFDVLMCYFTKREISKLVRTHKKLFSEDWKDLDYKINYLRIMLFASTRDIVESGALAHSMGHIRQRYLFVYRAGLFKRVRREEQYVIQRELNISLVDIFSTSLATFLKRTTNNLLRQEDFQAFVDSLKDEEFDQEFDRYLKLNHLRKKWTSAQAATERHERRHWMAELDMYNQNENDDDDDDDDQQSLTIVEKNSLVLGQNRGESQPSSWHPLSDYNPNRHRRRKLQQNSDPNIRL